MISTLMEKSGLSDFLGKGGVFDARLNESAKIEQAQLDTMTNYFKETNKLLTNMLYYTTDLGKRVAAGVRYGAVKGLGKGYDLIKGMGGTPNLAGTATPEQQNLQRIREIAESRARLDEQLATARKEELDIQRKQHETLKENVTNSGKTATEAEEIARLLREMQMMMKRNNDLHTTETERMAIAQRYAETSARLNALYNQSFTPPE